MNSCSSLDTTAIQRRVEEWLRTIVIGLNLCPFAAAEYRKNRIRFKVSNAESEQSCVVDLVSELSLIKRRTEIETTLLILPVAFLNFEQFNDFLGFVDSLLVEMNLEGEFQIASFHPDYQFAGTHVDDVENFSNRSPYPILHILRETSLSEAIDRHPDTEKIPIDNIALLNRLGREHMLGLLKACDDNDE